MKREENKNAKKTITKIVLSQKILPSFNSIMRTDKNKVCPKITLCLNLMQEKHNFMAIKTS